MLKCRTKLSLSMCALGCTHIYMSLFAWRMNINASENTRHMSVQCKDMVKLNVQEEGRSELSRE